MADCCGYQPKYTSSDCHLARPRLVFQGPLRMYSFYYNGMATCPKTINTHQSIYSMSPDTSKANSAAPFSMLSVAVKCTRQVQLGPNCSATHPAAAWLLVAHYLSHMSAIRQAACLNGSTILTPLADSRLAPAPVLISLLVHSPDWPWCQPESMR